MIFDKMVDKDYFSMEAINASSLKVFIENPNYYYNKYILKAIPFEPSPAMEFGTALHCYILEPELFNDKVVINTENLSMTTKAGKEFKELHQDKIILKSKDFRMIEIMAKKAISKIPAEWLSAIQFKEQVLTTQVNGVWVKGKVDWLIELDDKVINLDIKTTQSIDVNKMKWTVRDFMYDVQGAIYTKLINNNYLKQVENYLLFCDKKTLDCRLVNIDNMVHLVAEKVHNSIIELDDAIKNNKFNSLFDDILILE